MRSHLLPIADRKPLAWIVRGQRTAFGENRAREAKALEVGDVLFLYTTRGCFRNPTRDRGRVIGRALVNALANRPRSSPSFVGREFPYVVGLDIRTLSPLREGLDLASLVPSLKRTFPDPATWNFRMRRALVPLDSRDADTIGTALKPFVRSCADALPTYDSIEL